MALQEDDSMMHATRVGDLPPPAMFASKSDPQQQTSTNYQDILKTIDIKQMTQPKMTQPSMEVPASIQMQQPSNQFQQMPANQFQQTPANQFQQTPANPMQAMHTQNTMYTGTTDMPQSAPTGSFSYTPSQSISHGPVINSLLPDPMFFHPPPVVDPPKKRRPVETPKTINKLPSFDIEKLKPAILVAAIVFALLSWGAPVVAKRLEWTVDAITGKFTSSGLVVISILTGGIFLGATEIIRNFVKN